MVGSKLRIFFYFADVSTAEYLALLIIEEQILNSNLSVNERSSTFFLSRAVDFHNLGVGRSKETRRIYDVSD